VLRGFSLNQLNELIACRNNIGGVVKVEIQVGGFSSLKFTDIISTDNSYKGVRPPQGDDPGKRNCPVFETPKRSLRFALVRLTFDTKICKILSSC
jgi:hypothetical protein